MNDRRTNLSVLYARVFSVDPAVADIPWLTLQSPPLALGKRFIINRTLRYQAKYHWWEINHPALVADGIFVGLEKEHEVFEYTFRCKIPFHKAQDALEIARILADAEMLIGNQSLVMSLAVGLGTAYSQEVYDAAPNCIFKRSNARYF
jgi:hypothetical protein